MSTMLQLEKKEGGRETGREGEGRQTGRIIYFIVLSSGKEP